ncbi:MAG: CBS domain-containing protein [Candidatus Aenigmatarchaeota archaeon]
MVMKLNEFLVEKFVEKTEVILKDKPIKEAIDMMEKGKTGILPVVDKEGKLVGCLYEGDIIKLIKRGSPLIGFIWKEEITEEDKNRKVEEIMNSKVITIKKSETIETAINIMSNNEVDRLVVIEDERPIGILRIRTILKKIFDEIETKEK